MCKIGGGEGPLKFDIACIVGEVTLDFGLEFVLLSVSSPLLNLACWAAAAAAFAAACFKAKCFESLKVTVGTLFRPGSGVLLTTAPEVPLAFIIDLVALAVGLAEHCRPGETTVGVALPVACGVLSIVPSGLGFLATLVKRGDITLGVLILLACSGILESAFVTN